MKQFNTIKHFTFDSANYRLSDDDNDKVVLSIDYQNNQYRVISSGPTYNQSFRKEIDDIAADLLSRKHGIDLAK